MSDNNQNVYVDKFGGKHPTLFGKLAVDEGNQQTDPNQKPTPKKDKGPQK